MKKFFSQKFILILFAGLFLGGCQLEWRKEFNMDFPVFDMKFLDYFGDGRTYTDTDGGEHKYIKSERTLGGYKYEGFYVASEDNPYYIGNFGTFKGDGGFITNLIATVDTSTSNITIVKGMPFINNFIDGNKYGIIYTYSEIDNSLTGYDNVKYTYVTGSGDGVTTGTFSLGGTNLQGTVVSAYNVAITDIPFLNYFKNGETYDGYKYTFSDRSFDKKYSYNRDGAGGIGTFGNLYDSQVLIATVDDSAIPSVRKMEYIEYLKDNATYEGYTFHYVDNNGSYFEKEGVKFAYDNTGMVDSGTSSKSGSGDGTFGDKSVFAKLSSDYTTQTFVTVSVSVEEFIFNYVRSIEPNRTGGTIDAYIDNAIANYDSGKDTLVTMSGGAIADIYGADTSSIDLNSSGVKIIGNINGNLYICGDVDGIGVYINSGTVNGNIIVNGKTCGISEGIYLGAGTKVNGSIIVNGGVSSGISGRAIYLRENAFVGNYILVNDDVVVSRNIGIELLSGASVGKNIIVNGDLVSSMSEAIKNNSGITMGDMYLKGGIIGNTSGAGEIAQNVERMPVNLD